MLLKNNELDGLLLQLDPLLERTDIVGYAASRNAKLITELCAEYIDIKKKLIVELGEPVIDEEGNDTGAIALTHESKNFDEFLRRIGDVSAIVHEFIPFTINYEDGIGILSGKQFLELDWMFSSDSKA